MTTDSSRGPSPAARGPVRSAERELAPDLARGAMLLFIALVNAPGLAPGGPAYGALLQSTENAANALLSVFVHARAYPVFAIMFGYGMVQLARRQHAAGASPAQVRTLLLRRNAWLFVFGFAHAALLYFGDFLGAYAIIGAVATVALLGRAKVQRAVLWLWAISIVELVALGALVIAGIARGGGPAVTVPAEVPASSVASSYLASIVARLHEWPTHTLTVVPAIFIVSLGMWAAERRLLEDPARHGAMLRRIAIACLSVVFAGGVPLALVYLGIVHADARTFSLISYLHKVSGMFGGPGYVALFGLLAPWLSQNSTGAVARIYGRARRARQALPLRLPLSVAGMADVAAAVHAVARLPVRQSPPHGARRRRDRVAGERVRRRVAGPVTRGPVQPKCCSAGLPMAARSAAPIERRRTVR